MPVDTQDIQPTIVEIIADLACPWCYIGLVRLEKAFALRPEIRAELVWWPYLLNPQLPREGMERQTYLRSKFGGDAQAKQIYQRIAAAGEEEGIPFAFDKMTRTPNTVLAQRLILLAQTKGKGAIMIRTLFKALFEQGIDIGKTDALLTLGETTGLERSDIEGLFAGNDFGADVIRGHQRATMMGVQGVPVYLVDREHVISGAQAPKVLAGLLDVASTDAVA
ncbi:MAG: DsbA family oxidoreductase [Geminicoccaceae bacterium]